MTETHGLPNGWVWIFALQPNHPWGEIYFSTQLRPTHIEADSIMGDPWVEKNTTSGISDLKAMLLSRTKDYM
jgi:hypothetical protein